MFHKINTLSFWTRHRRLLVVALFATACFHVPVWSAEESAWQQQYNRGAEAYSKGAIQQAEQYFRSAISAAEGYGDRDARLATSCNSLALVYDDEGKSNLAEPLYRRALAIFEKVQPPDRLNVASVLNNLGEMMRVQKKFREAEDHYKRALKIREEISGPRSSEVAEIFNNLGLLYYAQNRYVQAESNFLQALAIWKSSANGELQVATCLNNLALLYSDQGKYSDAESLYQQALSTRESKLGSDHPSVATTLHNIAALNYSKGEYEQAQAQYKRALEIEIAKRGASDPRVATSLDGLASLYKNIGRLQDAADNYARALQIRERFSSTDTGDLAVSWNNLANIYLDLARYQEAETLLRKLLAYDQSNNGADSPRVAADLDNLGRALKGQNKPTDALRQQSMSIKQKLPGAQYLGAEDSGSDTIVGTTTGNTASTGNTTSSSNTTSRHNTTTVPTIDRVDQSEVTSNTKANRPIKDKWALVVGISNFRDPSINLRFAAKDATDFRQFLIKEEGFQPDHVKLLIDEKATRQNIVDYLGDRWLRRVARPDDMLVVYLSTHGSNSKREAVGVNFVVAYDTDKNNLILTGLPMEWLTQGIKEGVHCDRSILMLDVCHSGAAAPAEKGLERDHGFKIKELQLGTGQIVLASSQSDQISWESRNYPNGVFTHCLIEGLRSNGRNTRLQDAFSIMKNKVEEEVLRDRAELQTPVCRRVWVGDDAVIGTVAANPRAGLKEEIVNAPTNSKSAAKGGSKGNSTKKIKNK